jgi:hypothetical protein
MYDKVNCLSMSTERLDRIEAIIEANVSATQANTVGMAELRAVTQANTVGMAELRTQLQALTQAHATGMVELRTQLQALTQAHATGMAELRSTVNSLVQIVEIHQRNHEVSQRNFEVAQQRMDAMLAEIRGLRTESQRMIEHLFGSQGHNE